MGADTNSAVRILKLIDAARLQPQNVSTAVMWAGIFGLDRTAAETDPHAVQTKLRIVREEVDLLERQMSRTKFSKPLFSPYLSNVKSMISVQNFSAGWSNYVHFAGVDTILALRYCAEILPKEEEVDLDTLEALLQRVNDLRTDITTSDISESLQGFLLSQLEIIEQGIQEYPVRGKKALTRALRDGIADVATNNQAIRENGGSDQKMSVKSLWSDLINAGQLDADAEGLISCMLTMLSSSSNLTDAILEILPGATQPGHE